MTGDPASAVQEIRDTLGLSWGEVADLFDVSEITVIHWMGEGPQMAESNRQRLDVLVGRVRRLAAETAPGWLEANFKKNRPGEPSLYRRWCAEAIRDQRPVYRLSDTLNVADGPSGVEPYEVVRSGPMPEPTGEL